MISVETQNLMSFKRTTNDCEKSQKVRMSYKFKCAVLNKAVQLSSKVWARLLSLLIRQFFNKCLRKKVLQRKRS